MTLTRHLLDRRSVLVLSSSAAAMAATSGWADTAAPATPAAIDPASIKDYALGDPNAKIKMTEYLSFTCPHCEHFHEVIFPKLKADYIDTGKLQLTYHEVYFDQMGLLGAMVARCGGEMRYFGITDMLYNKQRDWLTAAGDNGPLDQLKTFAKTAGMDDATVDTCLHDQPMAEALVAHYQASIAKDYPNDSFQGTPSFLINGVPNTDINANMDYADLQKILDAELAK